MKPAGEKRYVEAVPETIASVHIPSELWTKRAGHFSPVPSFPQTDVTER